MSFCARQLITLVVKRLKLSETTELMGALARLYSHNQEYEKVTGRLPPAAAKTSARIDRRAPRQSPVGPDGAGGRALRLGFQYPTVPDRTQQYADSTSAVPWQYL